jgi:hypothetical protein
VDEQQVFAFLRKQKKAVLLDYLHAAFATMTAPQRRAVFADTLPRHRPTPVDGKRLRREIDQFRRDSLARKYYAPFDINSKNWMHVPEKTREWCDRFARFVAGARSLTARKEHALAVACFDMLYELLEALNEGEEIIFAEEVGSWMIPTDARAWLKAYLKSLAATVTPEAFTATVIPMIRRDSYHSFAGEVYASALKVAGAKQKAHLQAELQRQQIRTGPRP